MQLQLSLTSSESAPRDGLHVASRNPQAALPAMARTAGPILIFKTVPSSQIGCHLRLAREAAGKLDGTLCLASDG